MKKHKHDTEDYADICNNCGYAEDVCKTCKKPIYTYDGGKTWETEE